ncbi:hypothetical protein C6503_24815 [Candidatus Poribacteria bacterium]|nr:MAG: hypothetical protein C6503_24815 [Candidatus Poribacteria bacterium]
MPSKNVTGPLFGFLALIFGFAALVSLLFAAKPVFWIFLLLCATALVIFARLRFADFVNFFVSRQARYGANVALSIMGFIGIAIFINAIVAQRFDKRTDLTRDRLYSLSEPTRKILKSLNIEIQVTTFIGEKVPLADRQRTIQMLELYQREADLLTISHANPYIDIQLVEKYNIRRDGTVIFEALGRKPEKVTILEEQKFTSAILKLIRKKTKKIYFTVGHEERSVDDFNSTGYSEVKAELENQNYVAAPLSLLTQPTVPADCEVLVIAGPKNTLTSHEIGLVSKYLAQNGKLFLLLDPSVTSAKDVNKGLVQLMKRWGIVIGNDLVVDRASFVFELGPTAPFSSFEPHDITRSAMQVSIPFPVTRSVTPLEDRKATDSAGKPALDVKSLVKTINPTGVSWAETQRNTDETFNTEAYTPGLDMSGPVSIAVAAEKKNETRQPDTSSQQSGNTETETTESPTRIAVFGDSDFATNLFFRSASRDLFLATINWLTLEEDLIAIRPIDLRQQALRQMAVQDIRLVQITSVFLIPLIVFIAGLVVWWQRREGGSA